METDYNLQEELSDIKKELKKVSSELLELTVLNKFMHEERLSNAAKIERIDTEMASAKGAMSLLKWLISVFGMSIVAFCTYLISDGFGIQQKIANQSERITALEARIDKNQQDIHRLSTDVDRLESVHVQP